MPNANSYEDIYSLPIYPEMIDDDHIDRVVWAYRDWIRTKMDNLWVWDFFDPELEGCHGILIPYEKYVENKTRSWNLEVKKDPSLSGYWDDPFMATEMLQVVIDTSMRNQSYKSKVLRGLPDSLPFDVRVIRNLKPQHRPVFEMVSGQLEYRFTKVVGKLGKGMAPIEVLLSTGVLWKHIEDNPNYLEIQVRKSGLEEIDNYNDRLDTRLLRNPKKHGVMFHYPENRSVLVQHDGDELRFIFIDSRSTVPSPYAGVTVPIPMLLPQEGIISSKQLRNWLKPMMKLVKQRGFEGPEADMKDDNFIELANIMIHQGVIVPEIGYQFGRGVSQRIEGTFNIPMQVDEEVYELLLRSFKAFILLRSPQIVEKIKSDTRKEYSPRKHRSKRRVRVWGSDKIRYIYPPKNTGRKLPYHFVRGHVRRLSSGRITNVRPYYKGDIDVGYSDNSMAIGKSARAGYSQMALDWLRSIEISEGIEIQHAESGGELRIRHSNGHYLVDGYCEATNTVYEFHGDIWHGNPACFDPEDCPHPFRPEVTARQLHEATIAKEDFLRQHFNVVTIWESDWTGIKV